MAICLLVEYSPALLSSQIAERLINSAKATKPVLAFAGPLVLTSRPHDCHDGFFVCVFGSCCEA